MKADSLHLVINDIVFLLKEKSDNIHAAVPIITQSWTEKIL